MTAETKPHPAAVAYLDALAGDGWLVEVALRPFEPGESGTSVTLNEPGRWVVTVAKDDVRQVTTAYSRAVAVEQAAWHHGARWD